MNYDTNSFAIKVVSGSKDAVNDLIVNELQEYPKRDYGTIILELDENDHMKTVRIIRFKTKELCNGQELHFTRGQYPFDSGVSL